MNGLTEGDRHEPECYKLKRCCLCYFCGISSGCYTTIKSAYRDHYCPAHRLYHLGNDLSRDQGGARKFSALPDDGHPLYAGRRWVAAVSAVAQYADAYSAGGSWRGNCWHTAAGWRHGQRSAGGTIGVV